MQEDEERRTVTTIIITVIITIIITTLSKQKLTKNKINAVPDHGQKKNKKQKTCILRLFLFASSASSSFPLRCRFARRAAVPGVSADAVLGEARGFRLLRGVVTQGRRLSVRGESARRRRCGVKLEPAMAVAAAAAAPGRHRPALGVLRIPEAAGVRRRRETLAAPRGCC